MIGGRPGAGTAVPQGFPLVCRGVDWALKGRRLDAQHRDVPAVMTCDSHRHGLPLDTADRCQGYSAFGFWLLSLPLTDDSCLEGGSRSTPTIDHY